MRVLIMGALLCAMAAEAQAQGASKPTPSSRAPQTPAAHPQPRPPFERIRPHILSTTPKTKADKVDQERLTVRRLDVVDANGVIRLSVAGDAVNPVMDGVEYRRGVNTSGIILWDENGNEKGGLGYVSTPAGGAVTLAMDYATADAVGVQVLPDRSVQFVMNAPPPEYRYEELGGARAVGVYGANRVLVRVAPDGTPQVALNDDQARSRVRMTVTQEGYGAIEFLDAAGKVIHTLAPEAALQPKAR